MQEGQAQNYEEDDSSWWQRQMHLLNVRDKAALEAGANAIDFVADGARQFFRDPLELAGNTIGAADIVGNLFPGRMRAAEAVIEAMSIWDDAYSRIVDDHRTGIDPTRTVTNAITNLGLAIGPAYLATKLGVPPGVKSIVTSAMANYLIDEAMINNRSLREHAQNGVYWLYDQLRTANDNSAQIAAQLRLPVLPPIRGW